MQKVFFLNFISTALLLLSNLLSLKTGVYEPTVINYVDPYPHRMTLSRPQMGKSLGAGCPTLSQVQLYPVMDKTAKAKQWLSDMQNDQSKMDTKCKSS